MSGSSNHEKIPGEHHDDAKAREKAHEAKVHDPKSHEPKPHETRAQEPKSHHDLKAHEAKAPSKDIVDRMPSRKCSSTWVTPRSPAAPKP